MSLRKKTRNTCVLEILEQYRLSYEDYAKDSKEDAVKFQLEHADWCMEVAEARRSQEVIQVFIALNWDEVAFTQWAEEHIKDREDLRSLLGEAKLQSREWDT